jgi:quercetin dioxygenase-like cupin family protein
MKRPTLLFLALLPALAIAGQDAATTPAMPAGHAMVRAAQTAWGDGPPMLPKGVQAAVLYGDPGEAGPFAIRLKTPAGYRVPRHWHPTDEQVTVIEGEITLSMGEAASAHAETFGAGDYVNLPARMQHEATMKSDAVVQINAMGPFEITYVDPADDPRKTMPATEAAD